MWHCLLNNKQYKLKCSIISNDLNKVHPGIIINKPKPQLKRLLSQNDIASASKRIDTKANTTSVIKKGTKKVPSQVPSTPNIRSQVEVSQISKLSRVQEEVKDFDTEEFQIKKIKNLANNLEFPKKTFMIDGKLKYFTPILHFTISKRKFEKNPTKSIDFKCKICDKKVRSPLAKSTNIIKHLKQHSVFNEWEKKYKKHSHRNSKIDDKVFDLVKFFITSNCSMSTLENEHLVKLLSNVMHMPGVQSLRDTLIPEVYGELRNSIQSKLEEAETICLIADIWTNGSNSDFIALVAVLTNSDFEREFLIMDMMRMPGESHNAENLKVAIEKMVNFCELS